MIEQDYLMRLIGQFVAAMVHAWRKAGNKAEDLELPGAQQTDGLEDDTDEGADPLGAAAMIEVALSEALGMDSAPLLALAPESLCMVIQVADVPRELMPYVVRSLYLEAQLLVQAGRQEQADLREAQADALSAFYGL